MIVPRNCTTVDRPSATLNEGLSKQLFPLIHEQIPPKITTAAALAVSLIIDTSVLSPTPPPPLTSRNYTGSMGFPQLVFVGLLPSSSFAHEQTPSHFMRSKTRTGGGGWCRYRPPFPRSLPPSPPGSSRPCTILCKRSRSPSCYRPRKAAHSSVAWPSSPVQSARRSRPAVTVDLKESCGHKSYQKLEPGEKGLDAFSLTFRLTSVAGSA